MSFILVPKQGAELQVNAWTWRPTLELLRAANVVDRDHLLDVAGIGAGVDAQLAGRIADEVDRWVSDTAMKPGQRVLFDGSITSAPKEAAVFSPTSAADSVDENDLYSATYEWLVTFRDFCRQSGGFDVS